MRLVVIGTPGAWHVGRLAAVAAARGHVVDVVGWQALGAMIEPGPARLDCVPGPARLDCVPGPARLDCVPGPARLDCVPGPARERFLPDAVERADAIVVRGMPAGRLEEVIVRMDLLGRLEARGTAVVNAPRALEAAIDKYLSLARLAAAGIPVPRTVVTQSAPGVRAAWEALGRDAVVKPLFGSCGRGIERVATEEELRTLLESLEAEGTTTYLQERVEHPGWDVRVFLAGTESFAMRRRNAADWRTNLARGATAEPFDPPAEWLALARRSARLLGVEVAGVDLLPDRAGRPVVIEVNAVPGWRGLESAIAQDVTAAVVRFLEDRAGQSPPRHHSAPG